jgi:hypothetical protein
MNARVPAPAWRIIRDKGLGNAWFRCLNVLGYRRLYVLRRPLGEAIPSGPARLLLAIAWLTREEGCTAALTLAQPENRAALRTHASVGFRITGMVRSLLLGPWRYHWPIQPVPEATASSIHDGLNHVP